jgi:Na+/H+ antiporter NhaD/arsenite permease-like protein
MPAAGSRDHPVSPTTTRQIICVIAMMVALLALVPVAALSSKAHGGNVLDVEPPPQYWPVGIICFIAILACIALLPLMRWSAHWWHSNQSKLLVAGAVSLATLLYYALAEGISSIPGVLDHAVLDEYIPFMTLLFSLYVIGGGVSLRGDLPAHPLTNTAFLAFGALIASFVGTTGASMLLIRPLLQTNSERKRIVHTVVFFIFLVSNIGGCLLPIGDPPLFLGFLRGVPFWWTFSLWKEWAFCCAVLLVVYFIWDTIEYRREAIASIQRDELLRQPLRVRGLINLLWMAGVIAAVAFINPTRPLPGASYVPFQFMRELVMLALVALSLLTSPAQARLDNQFNYGAIIEVAALFIGIFISMQVPMAVLRARGAELQLDEPWELFWATGSLSSFLDNAPTYIVFFQAVNALTHQPGPGVLALLNGDFIREDLLVAISLGAVFMGANTYIGNGPNFMVKSIAEQSGVPMPSFFGYFFRYAVPILLPLFIAVTLVFLI